MSEMLYLALALPEGLRVSGAAWNSCVSCNIASDPPFSCTLRRSRITALLCPSSSYSCSNDRPHLAAEFAPSTQRSNWASISRIFRFLDLQERLRHGVPFLFKLLSDWVLVCINLLSSFRAIRFPGRAARSRGSDGKSKGIMKRESNNSPKAWGGRAGSHNDLSNVLSNKTSILWNVDTSEGTIDDWMLAVSFAKDDTLSLSRSRSEIWKVEIIERIGVKWGWTNRPLFWWPLHPVWLCASPNLFVLEWDIGHTPLSFGLRSLQICNRGLPDASDKIWARMQMNSLEFTWRGFRFFMVWIVSTRSENSVIDERRWIAYVNIEWMKILGPYLEPVEKVPYWRKMTMDPSWEFRVLYPLIYWC